MCELGSAQVYCTRVENALKQFYNDNPQIGASHGLSHVMAVHEHAVNAIESHNSNVSSCCGTTILSDLTSMEIRVAAMLHDADDKKYFPLKENEQPRNDGLPNMSNAIHICESAGISQESITRILKMISWVGCTENGNSIPSEVEDANAYYLLIPRWSDRLEAVGVIGVVRCYQYNREIGSLLCKENDLYDSPRPKSEEELWRLATPERFEQYLKSQGGRKKNGCINKREAPSMISHYYDKLLHVACPPRESVRNKYLEEMARQSSKALLDVCLRFGKTGVVDEDYILSLEKEVSKKSKIDR